MKYMRNYMRLFTVYDILAPKHLSWKLSSDRPWDILHSKDKHWH